MYRGMYVRLQAATRGADEKYLPVGSMLARWEFRMKQGVGLKQKKKKKARGRSAWEINRFRDSPPSELEADPMSI